MAQIRALFVRAAVIPPTETTPAVEYAAGSWYDNVPAEHLAAAGASAVRLTRKECGHLVTPDDKAVYSESVPKVVPGENGPETASEIKTRIVPHASICPEA